MSEYSDPPDEVVALVRAACEHLPEIREEKAWAGTRWMVRQRNVAHVLAPKKLTVLVDRPDIEE